MVIRTAPVPAGSLRCSASVPRSVSVPGPGICVQVRKLAQHRRVLRSVALSLDLVRGTETNEIIICQLVMPTQ